MRARVGLDSQIESEATAVACTGMELHADARISFPREIVFSTYRDEITKLLPYIHNVRSIHLKSRKDEGAVVELVNEWRGGGDIPAAIRAVLSDSVLEWTDYATWRSEGHRCDWRTETHAFTDAVRCQGSTLFFEDGADKTTLQIRGSLEVDAKKIRGVPSFLAGKLGRAVEEFLVGKIQSNLIDTANGVAKYLEGKTR
jgi:hypothetical protein